MGTAVHVSAMVAAKGLHKAEDGSADLPWALVLSPTSCVSLSLLISKLLVITSLGVRAYGDNLPSALLSEGAGRVGRSVHDCCCAYCYSPGTEALFLAQASLLWGQVNPERKKTALRSRDVFPPFNQGEVQGLWERK